MEKIKKLFLQDGKATTSNFEESFKWNEQRYISQHYEMASISYTLIFCLAGMVLTTVEPFKTCSKCENGVKILIECFFIFMYTVSIIWIIIMYILITKAKRQKKIAIKDVAGIKRRVSIPLISSNDKLKEIKNIRKHAEKKLKSLKEFELKENEQDLDEIQDEDSIKQNQILALKPLEMPKDDEEHDPIIHHVQQAKLSVADLELSKFYFTYDYENGTGELYMRVGTAIFSMCAMIERCLSLIQMVEAYLSSVSTIEECKITFCVSVAARTTSIIFIFLQSFFIFKYANIIINYGKNYALIGLMHIICTNFCVFLRTLVHETVAEIHHSNQKHNDVNHHGRLVVTNTTSSHSFDLKDSEVVRAKIYKINQIGCINTIAFSSGINTTDIQYTQDKLSSYLYPCIIEYSLMCMTIFYVLWSCIDKKYNAQQSQESESMIRDISVKNYEKRNSYLRGNSKQMIVKFGSANEIIHASQSHEIQNERREIHSFVVDCGKSTTGLFVGIFVLLVVIISLIAYFIYRDKDPIIAIHIIDILEIALISLSLIVCIAIFVKFKRNKFDYITKNGFHYNETLILVGLAGIYLFGFYSIFAILNNGVESSIEALSLSIQIIAIIESTTQSILVIEGLKLQTEDKLVKKLKPARSLITLLILIDISLWLSETFTFKKYAMNKIQIDYYDIVFWSIASTVASPLAIFFRFHSSVCLSDIWKVLYE